jgi:hypothetical protein
MKTTGSSLFLTAPALSVIAAERRRLARNL